MKRNSLFQSAFQIKNLKIPWNCCLQLMVINCIMCTSKILTDLRFTKQRIKPKEYYCKSCLRCFSSKHVLTKHKEVCLSINGAQSARLKKETIEFKNYFKQILVAFKIYADFECNLKAAESYEGSYSEKYQDHVPSSFAYKLVCVDDEFNEPIGVFRGENAAYEFIKTIFKEYQYCKKVMKKNLTKKNNFNRVTLAGFVKNSLMMTIKK